MDNQCRSCGSAVHNPKGRNLFHRRNSKLLSSISLATHCSLEKDPDLPSCICASCAEHLNRADTFRARFIKTQENLLQRRAALPENDSDDKTSDADGDANADETAQDALKDPLISGLGRELGGRTDFQETDSYETALVADLLITSLQKDAGHTRKSRDTESIVKSAEPGNLGENSAFRSTRTIRSSRTTRSTPSTRSSRTTRSTRSTRSTRPTSSNVAQLAKGHSLRDRTHMRRSCTIRKCEFCGQILGNPSALALHMRHRHSEKSFMCSYCSQTFTTKGNTMRHESTHSRQGAFPCSTCGISFSRAFSLKGHITLCHTQTSF